jgi:hypothetical protein
MELLRSRAKLGNHGTAAAPEPDSDEDECQAFGFLRGVRDRSLNLELRFLNGNRMMLSYAWWGTAIYNLSHGILCKFVGDLTYLVLIEGSNLNSMLQGGITLFDRGLHRHRVIWVREMSRSDQERAAKGETLIDQIRVVSYRQDEGPPTLDWLEPFQDAIEKSTA